MKKYILSLIGLLAVCVAPFSYAAPARSQSADQTSTPQVLQVHGLGIDPFLIEADVVAGQASEYTITLTNTTDQPLSFETSINDFTTNGTSGQPLFLPSDKQSDPKYSLSAWVKVTEQPQFTIAPRAQTKIKFTITPPSDAEVGTHYGGLLFGQPERRAQAGQETVVQNKVGTIILARLGKANEQGTISGITTDKRVYQQSPINFTVTFNNYGNVHSKPKGDIYLKNIFGQEVADLQVNRDAQIILPATQRSFDVSWRPQLAFGRYTAEAVMYFGNPKLETRATVSFWVIPVRSLLILAGSALIALLFLYVIIKRYNRFIINRSRSRKSE